MSLTGTLIDGTDSTEMLLSSARPSSRACSVPAPLQKSSPFLLPSNGRNGNLASLDGVGFSEGELLLKVQDINSLARARLRSSGCFEPFS